MKNWLISAVVCSLLLLVFAIPGYAIVGPQGYITEQITCHYDYDGSVLTAASKTGQVLVSVPNNEDVLQAVNITLTGYHPNTTMTGNQGIAYRNVITSYGSTNSTQNLYVDTSAGSQQSTYTLNSTDAAPTINLSITWSNQKGGTDLYDSDNLYYTENNLTFNVTIKNPSGQKDLSNVNVTIYFAQDTQGGNDAVEITGMASSLDAGGTSRGTMDSWDLDDDGQVDTANWEGDLQHDNVQSIIYLKFYANITEATNFASDGDSHDVDGDSDKGGNANHTLSGSTYSGSTISAKFARGPIRQGIDLSLRGNYWHVRGLIRNMAAESPGDGNVLTYNVSYWKVYEISPEDGAPMTPANQTGDFLTDRYLVPSDGRIYTTDASRSSDTSWFNTTASSGSKPFYSISMDWQVVWDSESNDIYTGYINTTMDLPTLYVIDFVHDKRVTDGYVSPDTGNENVTFNDNVTFEGSTNAPGHEVEIYSIIPGKTIGGLDHGDWDVQVGQEKFKLYYVNDTGTYRLNISADQDIIDVTVTDPSAGTDGKVNVSTYDFSSILMYGSTDTIGNDMDDGSGNDKLWLTYVMTSSSEMTTGDNYLFNGTVTMETDTGTPLIELQNNDYVNVSGRRLIGWKQLIALDGSDPNNVTGRLLLEVEDGTGNGIPGIKFIDYIPDGIMSLAQYQANVTVWFYDGSWSQWTEDVDYKITDNGTHTLPDGSSVHAFEFINASAGGDTWNLTNGQMINVTYNMDVNIPGLYVLPMIISAFDPATGETFGTSAYGVIKIVVQEPTVPLEMSEGELELAKRVVVGNPVLWIKNFDVFNPNSKQVKGSFETTVFRDVMDGSVSYYNEEGDKIELPVGFTDVEDGMLMHWEDMLNPLETRAYEARVLTPPVLEIDRDVEVLEQLEDRMVKLKMDVYLKNFAEEDYQNIIFNLPISYQNILEVRDAFGNQLAFTGGAESTSITIDSLDGNGIKTVTIIYKESFPTIIITPDRDKYDLEAPVNLEILVINGGDEIDYPYVEIEIYTPQMDVMFTEIERLDQMEPLEKTEMYEKFLIPAYAPGGMYIASAKFREDFVTLASATGNFLVVGGAGVGIPESVQILIVLIVIIVLAYFSIRRLREVRKSSGRDTGVVRPL